MTAQQTRAYSKGTILGRLGSAPSVHQSSNGKEFYMYVPSPGTKSVRNGWLTLLRYNLAVNRPPKKDANGELLRDDNGFPVRDTDWYVHSILLCRWILRSWGSLIWRLSNIHIWAAAPWHGSVMAPTTQTPPMSELTFKVHRLQLPRECQAQHGAPRPWRPRPCRLYVHTLLTPAPPPSLFRKFSQASHTRGHRRRRPKCMC
jgi:hypothetical protein